MGNLTGKAFLGVGNLNLNLGKIEREVSGFKLLFFWRGGGGGGAPKSLTAINMCLDEMEEFKGRDTALQKQLTKKKGLQK